MSRKKQPTYYMGPVSRMSDTKWTPGPWVADEYRPDDWRVKAPDAADGCWWICECASDSEANAHLIAAAPALYAELERASDVLRHFASVFNHPNFTDRYDDGGTAERAIERIERELAKARGEVLTIPTES